MKRFCTLLMSIVILLTMSITAFAAEDTLKIYTATAKKGETVYVTVELTESVVGNAMSVMYSYNEKHLKAVSTSCSWVPTGVLQDFDRRNPLGVWTSAESTDLKGGVCVLAFEVKTLAKFTETEISCTVSVKNDSEDVGEFTATGKIILDCKHTYGDWQDGGNLGHFRKCSQCDGQQTESHQWNDGDLLPQSENSHQQTILFTCQVCEGTKTQVQNTGNQLIPPETEETTGPVTQWTPTEQETTPEHQHTESTYPEQQVDPEQQVNPEQAETNPQQDAQDEHAGHDHSQEASIPQDVLEDILQQEEDEHAGHNHTQTDTSGSPATGIAVVVVLAALIGGMVFFVKKKR